ncbi:radical SAM family heme chaperone HemW [Fusobacterium sp. PH5-44]|uniref:radical SAM family heme chaperone HemW n=1 Tax=unclassified Fusobacterium TaxID=2648384 RepID=UPI003D25B11D
MLNQYNNEYNVDALYIHIPFCIKKCDYCDFLSFKIEKDMEEKYMKYLLKELSMYSDYTYDTIYIGGGTPSIIKPENIKILLENIKIKPNSEITIEVNPKTVDIEKFIEYRQMGINRISIGIQSFDNKKLSILGRAHNIYEGKEAFFNSKKAGFDNVSLDLMFSTPDETIEELKNDLKELFELEPQHFSIYSLIWEEGTVFHEKLKKGIFQMTDNDLEGEMYNLIIEEAKQHNYTHYEISNFSKEEYQSKHNIKYWKNKNYVGIGLGASGYIENIRYTNKLNFDSYYSDIDNKKMPRDNIEVIDKYDNEKYKAILNLRLLNEGYLPHGDKYIKLCESLKEKKLLKRTINGKYMLTKKGLFIANDVMEVFL